MKRTVILFLGAVLGVSAAAGEHATALGACLGDHTSGKDRKDLARWIYVAMSEHPEMGQLSQLPAATKEDTYKGAGALFTRLIADSCAAQARAALKQEGVVAFQVAFESLGRLAMQELMADPNVNTAISGIARYADRKKLEAALGER